MRLTRSFWISNFYFNYVCSREVITIPKLRFSNRRKSDFDNTMLIYTLSQTLIAIRQLKEPYTGENQAEIII